METNRGITEADAEWTANGTDSNSNVQEHKFKPAEPIIVEGETIQYGGQDMPIRKGEWVFGTMGEPWFKPK